MIQIANRSHQQDKRDMWCANICPALRLMQSFLSGTCNSASYLPTIATQTICLLYPVKPDNSEFYNYFMVTSHWWAGFWKAHQILILLMLCLHKRADHTSADYLCKYFHCHRELLTTVHFVYALLPQNFICRCQRSIVQNISVWIAPGQITQVQITPCKYFALW